MNEVARVAIGANAAAILAAVGVCLTWGSMLGRGARRADGQSPIQPVEHEGATMTSPLVTQEIALVQARQDTPEMLSSREQQERLDAETRAMLAPFDDALTVALDDFRSATRAPAERAARWVAEDDDDGAVARARLRAWRIDTPTGEYPALPMRRPGAHLDRRS